MDRVDADSETLNRRSNHHRQLLDNNLKWQRKAEELAGRHEQRIAHLEGVLEERDVYISNIECMLAELSGRVSEMEGKLCRCRDEEDVKVAEVIDDDDPTSELSYETVYHTPVAIAGLLEDVPNRLVHTFQRFFSHDPWAIRCRTTLLVAHDPWVVRYFGGP